MGLEGKGIEIKVLILPLNFSVSTFTCLKNEYNMVRVGLSFGVFLKDFIFLE